MTNAMLAAAVVPFLAVGLWGQAVSSPFTANSPDVISVTKNHARDPVGFEFPGGRDPQHPTHYPDGVADAIRTQWYEVVSRLRDTSYEKAGVTVVEFRIKRDGTLDKVKVI
jgi:hypothetical protein